MFPNEVDIVIVGGGAAGCVVAGRLARADPTLQIAIVEAGQDNFNHPTVIQPAMYISHLAPGSTTANFYQSSESEHTAGRGCVVPVGGLLGGGSSINFMMYTRASASDYDDFKQPGWDFKDILPLARKTETYAPAGADMKLHGTSGPLGVSYGGNQSNLGKEFNHVVNTTTDVPYVDDLQDYSTGHGTTTWPKWIDPKTGRRSDAAHGFVQPLLHGPTAQTNLHLITESKTVRILFEGDKAVGIEYVHNPEAKTAPNPEAPTVMGEIKTLKARKLVVVSAGAFGTPMLLERSGLGDKEVLAKAGVECRVELPGVGREYQDHQLAMAIYHVADEADTLDDYLRGVPEVHIKAGAEWQTGQGHIATNAIDAGMKARPTPAELATMGPAFQQRYADYFENAPDKPVMFGGVVSTFLGDHAAVPAGKYAMMGAYLTYPMSSGHVHIRDASPFSAPDFDAGYLNHEADMAPQVWMFKKLREIMRRMPSYRGEFAAIHPKYAEDSPARCMPWAASTEPIVDLVYSDADTAAIEQWVRENVGTTWHSCLTAPMKARDEFGVVDARLNVYGTQSLKLADLSIIPSNLGTNTYSVALTVGEKAAQIIAEDLGIAGF